MNRTALRIILIAVLFSLSGCQIQGEYSDDFSTQQHWTTFVEDAGEVGYTYNHFRIAVNQPDTFLWTQADAFFRDVILVVSAAQTAGSEDNYFGLLCRIQESGEFYAGLVSSDGFYSIQKRSESGEMKLLSGDHWGISEMLAEDPPLKLIRFECTRNLLRLTANGTELAVIRDDSLSGGDVGMIAGTFEGDLVEILFDDFSALELSR